MPRFQIPTIISIFGVTGDLVERKILAALFSLYQKNDLPEKVEFIGFSRRNWTDQDLQKYLEDILAKKNAGSPSERARFAALWRYASGTFEDAKAYERLGAMLGSADKQWRYCANKLFYLSVPPAQYKLILKHLHDSGLTKPCSDKEGWTRVILEKPFGTDLKTAEQLDQYLGKVLKEEQIYRVDHYLAKETVRNLIAFRFSNSFLTPAWNNTFVEKIECVFNEQIAVSSRGQFYDGVGALRDVGQSHLLQLLAILTMDHPGTFTGSAIRAARARALSKLEILSGDGIQHNTVRAQYNGYASEPGVAAASTTETYFKIKASMHTGAFTGVPIYLSGGKALHETSTEVRVTFKHPEPCLCPPGEHLQNVLHYHISPDESMKIRFLVKKPGYEFALERKDFGFDYKTTYEAAELIAPYEQLLMDIIKGDQTLFISTDEIMAEWRFVEPIVKAWQKKSAPLISYAPGDTCNPLVPADSEPKLKKEIGIMGLGKMGAAFAQNLRGKNWTVVGFNRSTEKTQALAASAGIVPAASHAEFVKKLSAPRVVWLMLPAGEAVDQALFGKDGLVNYLEKGDIVLDAGNSFYKDAAVRSKKLQKRGIRFADVGFSGGPGGARRGGCFMVGGSRALFDYLLPLFVDGGAVGGVQHFEGVGAGHFVKMVHNGIEYGMMQAIAEGFTLLKKIPFKLDLARAAAIYNHGSVIESRLVGWLERAIDQYGADLAAISGSVDATGEGLWTVKEAERLKLPIKVIKESLAFRTQSKKKPSYTGKVVSALRNQFGGHSVAAKPKKK